MSKGGFDNGYFVMNTHRTYDSGWDVECRLCLSFHLAWNRSVTGNGKGNEVGDVNL
jgi:hypothetical protein